MARFFPLLPPRSANFSPPAPEIAVPTERSQNVLRSLYQQRSQVGIAFLADVHLRFALSGVSASRLQSQITSDITALAKTMRIFQRQQERQCDQRAQARPLRPHAHRPITA